MFRDKILISIFVLLFILGGILSATAEEQQSSGVDKIIAKMTTELNLTQEQAAAIKSILEEYRAKSEELSKYLDDEWDTDEAAKKDAMDKLHQEEDQKINQVLTQEQIDKFAQNEDIRQRLNHDKVNFADSQWGPPGSGEQVSPNFQF